MNAYEGSTFGQRCAGGFGRAVSTLRRLGSALFLSFSVAFVASLLVSVAIAPLANAADKVEKKTTPQLSPKVGVALKAASQAVPKKEYDVALKKIQEADAVAKKTAYDQFQIDEIRAYLYASQETNYPEIIAIYEKSLATPEFLTPEELDLRPKRLAGLNFNAKNYPKAIEYGKQWLTAHANDQAMIVLVGKAQYVSKDFKGALESMDSAIATSEAEGKTPEEVWLQLVPSCASQLDDQPRVIAGQEKLVRYYGKPEYWEKLLNRALKIEKNDQAALHVFRLMADVGVLAKSEDYMEYAQRAVERAMPGEAASVLESGFEKKILGVDKDKVAQQQKLAEIKKKAQADRAQLPEIEAEVRNAKAATGQQSVGLGLAYFSFAMYEKAIEALNAGIKKGGLKNIDDYRLALGVAYLRTGQKETARAQFQSVGADSPFARIAKLWAIRSYN